MNIFLFLLHVLALSASQGVLGFCPTASSRAPIAVLRMGLFDGIVKAFSNEEFAAESQGIKATARHILVKSEDDADELLEKLTKGDSFYTLAKTHSACPSSAQGGSLGSFSPGTMVAEFDGVVFSPDTKLGEVAGPVETQFGYHLIVVDKRTGV